jgi:hypothetical protein
MMKKKYILSVLSLVLIVFCCIETDKHSKKIIADQKQIVSPLLLSMGGFRNIISDILMVRLQYFIEANDFVEVQYLSKLIQELNPDSANLTIFNAWNLAYNVTIVIPDEQTKWYFLNSAIGLLTDAITEENSQKNARLRYELAVLFWNKLSNVSKEEIFYVELWNKKYGLRKNLEDNKSTFDKLKIDIDIARKLEKIYGIQDWSTSTPYIRYNAFMAKDKIGDNWLENIKVLLK